MTCKQASDATGRFLPRLRGSLSLSERGEVWNLNAGSTAIPKKLLCDTLHLSTDEFGAYCRALLWYYVNGPLPSNEKTIRTIMGVKECDWARTWGVLQAYFSQNGDGFWHQKRADMEIDRRNRIIERNRNRTEAARNAQESTRIVTHRVTECVTERLSQTERVTLDKEHDRVMVAMRTIENSYDANMTWRASDREKYRALKARRQELRKLLGVKA